MNKPKVVLVHGNGGSLGTDNWFPYTKAKLEALGLSVMSPNMPDNMLARESEWLPFLKNELRADDNTILIGHSSGAVAAMRYAENNKLYGSILVGACYTDLGDEDEKASGYYNRRWRWDKIKANQNWIVQFASTDDPYIPIKEARHIHSMLNTEYYEANNEGHYSQDRAKVEFPEIIEIIREKIK